MRPSLKIETWNLLSELGRTQSLVQAAERLEMGLPAASRLVSSLEKELGIELLDRKRKPAQIVTKSLELFSEADRIARQYQRLLKTVDSIKHQDTIKPKRILKVSLPANIDRSAYLNAFSNFERKHPGLRVEVLIDAGEEGLLNGATDVAYFGYRPAKEGITWIPAGHNVTFLMASRGYLRRHGAPQSVEELRNHTLLLRNTSNRSFSRRLENRDASFEIESDDDDYADEVTGETIKGLRKYGPSKEHRPNPIVEMGLFMDRDGIPLSMCITSGSDNEQTTAVPLEKTTHKNV